MWYIQTMECYSAVRRNEVLITRYNTNEPWKKIRLRGRRQIRRPRVVWFRSQEVSRIGKCIETESRWLPGRGGGVTAFHLWWQKCSGAKQWWGLHNLVKTVKPQNCRLQNDLIVSFMLLVLLFDHNKNYTYIKKTHEGSTGVIRSSPVRSKRKG